MALTTSDLDAIRLILREELEARERETVPPEPAMVVLAPTEQPATDEAAKRAAFVAEQPEWETVLGRQLCEGDEVLVNGFPFTLVREIERCGTIRQFSLNRGSMNFDDEEKYTRRVRPKRPEWATEDGIRWLQSVANEMRGFMSDSTADEVRAGCELRRRVPEVARAMLAEIGEAK